MRDLFDLLGLPFNAAASEVRRVCARRVHPVHPDFRRSADEPSAPSGAAEVRLSPDLRQMKDLQQMKDLRLTKADPSADVAVDFVAMSAFVERMQSGFFHNAE